MGAVTREQEFSAEERAEPRQGPSLSSWQMGRELHMSVPTVCPYLCRLFYPPGAEDWPDSIVRGRWAFESNADHAGILNFDGSAMDDW